MKHFEHSFKLDRHFENLQYEEFCKKLKAIFRFSFYEQRYNNMTRVRPFCVCTWKSIELDVLSTQVLTITFVKMDIKLAFEFQSSKRNQIICLLNKWNGSFALEQSYILKNFTLSIASIARFYFWMHVTACNPITYTDVVIIIIKTPWKISERAAYNRWSQNFYNKM